MAFVLKSVLSEALEKGRLGYISISFDSFSDANICNVTSGSAFSLGGAIHVLTGDETIDSDGTLAGGSNSTLYYIYALPTSLVFVCSTTVSTWNDSFQEYLATISGETARCVGSIYKNSGGTYEQKSIWYSRDFGILSSGLTIALGINSNRVLRFATDASITWNEAGDKFTIDKAVDIAGATNISGVLNPTGTLTLNSALHGFGTYVDKAFTASSRILGADETWIPPAGLYQFGTAAGGLSNGFAFEIYIPYNWNPSWIGGLVFCDGTNHRIRELGSSIRTIFYHKFDS